MTIISLLHEIGPRNALICFFLVKLEDLGVFTYAAFDINCQFKQMTLNNAKIVAMEASSTHTYFGAPNVQSRPVGIGAQ